MQPALATPEVLDQILVIGLKRQPQESCGVVLPRNLVIELPNIARNPTMAYKIDNDDLITALLPLFLGGHDINREDVIIWHTHPSGHIGPSGPDMETRSEGFRYLVVALPGGEATQF